jgi:hypothetical protein
VSVRALAGRRRQTRIVSFVLMAVALLSASMNPAAAAAYDQPTFTYDKALNPGTRAARVVDAPSAFGRPNDVGICWW